MLNDTVLVRAIGGKPAKLVTVEVGRGLVYVANPDSLSRVEAGESWPVGFPAEDVFWFDDAAYARLRALWEPTEKLDREEWRRFNLTLYAPRDATQSGRRTVPHPEGHDKAS